MMQAQMGSAGQSGDWFYDSARSRPLLDKAQEQETDTEKWRALYAIFGLVIKDPAGRRLLQAWANNLIHNPPDLIVMPERKHYFALRREHKPILEGAGNSKLLELIARGKLDTLQSAASQKRFLAGSLLPIGFAKILLGDADSNEVGAALSEWLTRWADPPSAHDSLMPKAEHGIKTLLDTYFEARTRLVNHNLRLVFSVARKLEGRQSFEDLAQDGFIGLIRAAEKYNCETGHRFSTYAYNWIMQSCRRGNDDMGAIIRFPPNIKQQLTAIIRERAEFTQKHGTEPTRQQLAERLDLEAGPLDAIMDLGNLSVSMAQPIGGEDSSLTLENTLVSSTYEEPDSDCHNSDLRALLLSRLATLNPLEQKVVTRRWGLDDAPVSTRKEVAAQLEVSTEWIRQVELSALEKLQSDTLLKEANRDL